MSHKFHIGEWYGVPFVDLSNEERIELSGHRVGGHALKKTEVSRLISLREKQDTGKLSGQESARLAKLTRLLDEQNTNEKPCPFRTDQAHPTCTKPGGVCSLQLYGVSQEAVSEIGGLRGTPRALCPYRFHQENIVFEQIAKSILGAQSPGLIGEVGFLKSTGNLDSDPGEDVGRIDMIIVDRATLGTPNVAWVAVEIQAVYFSGPEMKAEFDQIKAAGGRAAGPKKVRRPDYRSSGPKRLMPQLQIKVPTLRRWGKKMAIVVDEPFFCSMGEMNLVDDVSNADIVWVLVEFQRVPNSRHRQLRVVREVYTTLESSIDGLTGGVPVSLTEFEQRIGDKINL